MKAYIEIVMLDNLILTAAIAGLSYAFLGMRLHKCRTAVAASVGTVVAVTYPYWDFPLPLVIAAKALVGVALALILFVKLEKPLLGIAVFFLQTAAMGGICFAVTIAATGNLVSALTGPPALPYALPSVIGATAYFVVRFFLSLFRRKRTEAGYRYDAEITIAGRTARMCGFLDTGNGLYAETLPIVVVKFSSLAAAFGKEFVAYRVIGEKRIETVSGKGKLWLIKPDEFRLYSVGGVNTYKDVMLGVTELDFSRKEDMLLHPSVVGG